MNWTYLIGGIAVALTLLGLLHQLIVSRKNATIETLQEKNAWLEQQLALAKDTAPDVLAERLSKRVALLKEELEQLSKDFEANRISQELVKQKETELETTNNQVLELRGQLERAEELLGELEYYKEQFGCPHCGAELTTLGGVEDEYRMYACGYSLSPESCHPCPYDPEFPKLDEYELEIKQLSSGNFFCQPRAKIRNAYKLNLQAQTGKTEDETIDKIIKNYQRLLPRKLQQSSV